MRAAARDKATVITVFRMDRAISAFLRNQVCFCAAMAVVCPTAVAQSMGG